jgi:hypothetical protein
MTSNNGPLPEALRATLISPNEADSRAPKAAAKPVSNMLICCARCNNRKGIMPKMAFRKMVGKCGYLRVHFQPVMYKCMTVSHA